MKKAITLSLLIMTLFCYTACAEGIDLSGLSFAELAALRDRAQLEMFQRDEWQKVEVPAGVYQVGVQIPAGIWTITCEVGYNTAISWGEKLKDNGQDIDHHGRSDFEAVYNPKSEFYDRSYRTEYTFTVREGDYIVIEYSPAIFTPGASAPTFTFK